MVLAAVAYARLEGDALVDTRETYDGSLMSTLNPDPMRLLAYEVARKAAGTQPVHKIGWQAESLPKLLAATKRRGRLKQHHDVRCETLALERRDCVLQNRAHRHPVSGE